MANIGILDAALPAQSANKQPAATLAPGAILFRSDTLECRYSSAFDHIETGAVLVIIGITPSAVQQTNADHALQIALRAGLPPEVAAREAKFAGSFSGPLRRNLVAMLDHIGAHKTLALETCAHVFDPRRRGLVHFTSALRHPVFVGGANYNGVPDMIRTPALRIMVETYLAEEARALPGALWLPLGPKPFSALQHLAMLGVLDPDRILPPIPHPGGANGERIAFFLERKPREALSIKTNPEPIEQARDELRRRFAAEAIREVGV